MKKLMFAAAAIAASAAMAIESENIVGYATQGLLNNDMTMYGMQFEKVDGTPITLADLQGDFFGGPTQADADTISLWLDDGYHFYFYGYWDDPEWDYKWYDAGENDCSDVEIPAGRALWYIRRTSGDPTITVAGAVKSTPKNTTILANDMTMFCNPYPADIALKNLVVTDPKGGPTQADADTISLWLPDGYHFYFYGYWDDPEWDYKWYDAGENDCSDVKLPVGRACWYIRRANTATVLNFSSPIAK